MKLDETLLALAIENLLLRDDRAGRFAAAMPTSSPGWPGRAALVASADRAKDEVWDDQRPTTTPSRG
jgi:hypothetical protein